jgi:hypothetical protein
MNRFLTYSAEGEEQLEAGTYNRVIIQEHLQYIHRQLNPPISHNKRRTRPWGTSLWSQVETLTFSL